MSFPSFKYIKIDPRPDLFYFNEELAEEPILFAEQLLKLSGDWEGMPFVPFDYQKEIALFTYGSIWRDGPYKDQRRIRKMFLDGPKDIGKSPFLASLGCFHAFYEPYIRPLIFSIAGNIDQAKIVFDRAKEMIQQTPSLDRKTEALETLMRFNPASRDPTKRGLWRIRSALNKAPSGAHPSLTLIDEAHEIPDNAASGIDKAEKNAMKRDQSLFIMATNTGENLESVWGAYRQRAEKIIQGKSAELNFLPVIFCADEKADISKPETWHSAYPVMNQIKTEQHYHDLYEETRGDKAKEISFRRLNLGQVVQGSQAWLNIDEWKSCLIDKSELTDAIKKECSLWIGIDLGPKHDITGVAYVWIHKTTNQIYVEVDMYLPKAAAETYWEAHLVPYNSARGDKKSWADDGFISILDIKEFGVDEQIKIADEIAAKVKPYKVECVCYDSFGADALVHRLAKQHGMLIEAIQWFSRNGVAPATRSLERLINADVKKISIVNNACLNWQAKHVRVEIDKHDNIFPAKPGSKRGDAWRKIDGIMAIIYAMARAVRLTLDEPSKDELQRKWDGTLFTIKRSDMKPRDK